MINSLVSTLFSKPALLDEGNLMFNIAGKLQLYAVYDYINDQVQFDVVLEPNSYLVLGFGSTLTSTDLVYWSANGLQEDLFAYAPNMIV